MTAGGKNVAPAVIEDRIRAHSLISDYQEAQRQRDAARLELANETAKPDDQRGSLRENALATEFAATERSSMT